MRPDSYKKEEAEKLVVAAQPNWLVIGFQSDGFRGIPRTFNMIAESSNTNEGVYAIIRKLEPPFRVLQLDQNIYHGKNGFRRHKIAHRLYQNPKKGNCFKG